MLHLVGSSVLLYLIDNAQSNKKQINKKNVLIFSTTPKHFLCKKNWASYDQKRILILTFHPTPGSKRSSKLHKMYQSRCTVKNSWWWAERLPETCRVVIPIKLEFGASVGFIHKESFTMHGHTIVKKHIKTMHKCSCRLRSIGNILKVDNSGNKKEVNIFF